MNHFFFSEDHYAVFDVFENFRVFFGIHGVVVKVVAAKDVVVAFGLFH